MNMKKPILLLFFLPSYLLALAITDLSPKQGDTINIANGLTVSVSIGSSGYAVESAHVEVGGLLYEMTYNTDRLFWTATLPQYAVPLGEESIKYHAIDFGGNKAYLDLPVRTVDQPVLEQVKEPTTETRTFHVVSSPYVGGKVIGDTTVAVGDVITLTAQPNPGFVFSGWTGDVNSTNNPLLLYADYNLTIIANFTGDLEDSDDDGLLNYEEVHTYGTSKWTRDTDGDGLTDKQEVDYGWNPLSNDRAVVDAVTEMKALSGATPYVVGWFYTDGKWMYTDVDIYPYIYNSTDKAWLYFQSGNETPRYYNYKTHEWMQLR